MWIIKSMPTNFNKDSDVISSKDNLSDLDIAILKEWSGNISNLLI